MKAFTQTKIFYAVFALILGLLLQSCSTTKVKDDSWKKGDFLGYYDIPLGCTVKECEKSLKQKEYLYTKETGKKTVKIYVTSENAYFEGANVKKLEFIFVDLKLNKVWVHFTSEADLQEALLSLQKKYDYIQKRIIPVSFEISLDEDFKETKPAFRILNSKWISILIDGIINENRFVNTYSILISPGYPVTILNIKDLE